MKLYLFFMIETGLGVLVSVPFIRDSTCRNRATGIILLFQNDAVLWKYVKNIDHNLEYF